MNDKRRAAHNSGFKKLAVQWLIEHLCFVSSAVLADSFVLRNRQLLKPAKPLGASVADDKTTIDKLIKHRKKEWH